MYKLCRGFNTKYVRIIYKIHIEHQPEYVSIYNIYIEKRAFDINLFHVINGFCLLNVVYFIYYPNTIQLYIIKEETEDIYTYMYLKVS